MLLQIDSNGLVQLLLKMPIWVVSVCLFVLIFSPVVLSIIRLLQASKSKKEEALRTSETNMLLERILECTEGKVIDRISLSCAKIVIERFYESSMMAIQAQMAHIYLKNNIHSAERTPIIKENIKTTIKNCYNRDSGNLKGFKYKNKRLSDYMIVSISPQRLTEEIIDRLYKKAFSAEDMHKYIECCFEKYINDTIKYYEEF